MEEWTSSAVFLTNAELLAEWHEMARELDDPRSDELSAELLRRGLLP